MTKTKPNKSAANPPAKRRKTEVEVNTDVGAAVEFARKAGGINKPQKMLDDLKALKALANCSIQ